MQLNLPPIVPKIKLIEDTKLIFDALRKKYLVLTPEEWVRQHFVSYLINQLHFSAQLIGLEKKIKLNGTYKRCDIIAFNRSGRAVLIVECKAPAVKITQKTFDQIARYNLVLDVDWLIVTNGLDHFCCKMNPNDQTYKFVQELPKGEIQNINE